ncbi:MAG: hypothetical protein ACXVCI_19430 [Bdellovibrionota bacterium]
MFSKVNWGAIFAGAFIGIASMVLFSLFSLAVGISGVNVIEPLISTISVPAATYTVLTAMISFGLAGYCTTRLANLRNPGIACLHSLTTFSIAGAMVPFLFTRTFLSSVPGFAIAPPPGMFISLGLAWTLFLSFGLASAACCAGGVQACYREQGLMGAGFETEREERWPAA